MPARPDAEALSAERQRLDSLAEALLKRETLDELDAYRGAGPSRARWRGRHPRVKRAAGNYAPILRRLHEAIGSGGSYSLSSMTGITAPAQESAATGGRAGAAILRRLRIVLSSVAAAVLGVLPHVLHHAGPLAGAALFAGLGGSLLFGALGLIAAIPFLVRMRRHCGNWRRPLAALALFAAVFAVSTFVVGPALTSDDEDGPSGPDVPAAPARPEAPAGHEVHH